MDTVLAWKLAGRSGSIPGGKETGSAPGYRHVDESAGIEVEVYWRPGCPYCHRLRRTLARRGIQAQWRNIWDDDTARSFVREANDGDETVPTVRVGRRVLTNPDGAQIAALLPAEPDDPFRLRGDKRRASWFARLTGR